MLICHKGHTDTIQVYSVTVMTHVKALQAGHSSQGTSEPITPAHHLRHTYVVAVMITRNQLHVINIMLDTDNIYAVFSRPFIFLIRFLHQ